MGGATTFNRSVSVDKPTLLKSWPASRYHWHRRPEKKHAQSVPSLSNWVDFAYSNTPSPHFLACSFFGRFLTCSSTTDFACITAAVALDHTVPHPHPPGVGAPAAAAGGGVSLRGSFLDADAIETRELDDSERTIGDPAESEVGRSGAGAPTLTLSVLFLSVGVPARERGRSIWMVGRGGSELFCVISSMNA